ncbi:MAG: sialate O-acetylesterase [Phocaeicola sp.]
MKKMIFTLAVVLFPHLLLLGQGLYQNNVEKRKMVSLDRINNTTVLFTFGQSNSANYGQMRPDEHERLYSNIYNYCDGNLFYAQEPLLGANGDYCSVWSRVAALMIDKEMSREVTIIPIGIGGVQISEWAKGGKHHSRLTQTLDKLTELNIAIDYICWHQGESDNIAQTSTEEYITLFESIKDEFRSRGIEAPFIVALATYHPYSIGVDKGISTDIRRAQKSIIRQSKDVFIGPDTDKLNALYHRHDGVHFSTLGLDEHARMWLKSLQKIKK